MNFFGLNKFFDTTGRDENYKKSTRAMTIWMMIVIAISMIAVWGTVCETYMNSAEIVVGIDSYVYNGWKYMLDHHCDDSNFLYFTLLIISFVVTLVITYFLGIKAFVKGLRSLSSNEDANIFPYFIVIALANYFYFRFGYTLSLGAFQFVDVSLGWGSVVSGIIFIPSIIGTILFCVISSYNKEQIPEFVGRLFMAVSIFLIFGIMSCVLDGYFTGNDATGIWQTLDYAIEKGAPANQVTLFIFQFIIELLIYFVGFYTVIQTAVLVIGDYPEKNKGTLLIAPLLLFVLVAVSLFSNGISQEIITMPSKIFRINVDGSVITSFVLAVILTTINLTNYFINNK